MKPYILNKMEKHSKKKHHFYTQKFKLKVSDWYMNNGRTAQTFGVDQKQVRTWLKNKEIIEQQKYSSKWRLLYMLSIKKQEQKENGG